MLNMNFLIIKSEEIWLLFIFTFLLHSFHGILSEFKDFF
jgi:hypothetical protein